MVFKRTASPDFAPRPENKNKTKKKKPRIYYARVHLHGGHNKSAKKKNKSTRSYVCCRLINYTTLGLCNTYCLKINNNELRGMRLARRQVYCTGAVSYKMCTPRDGVASNARRARRDTGFSSKLEKRCDPLDRRWRDGQKRTANEVRRIPKK